jgi:hypothetical protein
MMDKAKRFDKGNLGIPVAQTVVKAFLLRPESDMTSAQLAVANADKELLQKEREEVKQRIFMLDEQIKSCSAEKTELAEQVQKQAGKDDLEANISQLEQFGDKAFDEWKVQGTQACDAAVAKDVAGDEANTEDLDNLMKKVQEIANQIQDSEMAQTAMAHGQTALEQGQVAAAAAAQTAQQAALQAQQAADAALKSEAMKSAMSKASEAADKAKKKLDK